MKCLSVDIWSNTIAWRPTGNVPTQPSSASFLRVGILQDLDFRTGARPADLISLLLSHESRYDELHRHQNWEEVALSRLKG